MASIKYGISVRETTIYEYTLYVQLYLLHPGSRKHYNIENNWYYFACCSVWVYNLVSDIIGEAWFESV
jgi:hypothetical protein